MVRIRQALNQFGEGVSQAFSVSPDNYRDLLWDARSRRGLSEPQRMTQIAFQNPLILAARRAKSVNPDGWQKYLPVPKMTDETLALMGNVGINLGGSSHLDLTAASPILLEKMSRENRNRVHQAFDQDVSTYKDYLKQLPTAQKVGDLVGHAGNDFVNNASRASWWLLNAPQAVVDVASEAGTALASPDLFSNKRLHNLRDAAKAGKLKYAPKRGSVDAAEVELVGLSPEKLQEYEQASRNDPRNYVRSAPGVRQVNGEWVERRFNPNLVTAAAMTAPATAIAGGIQLLNRPEGYQAVIPNEDDPRQSDNLLMEIGSRYVLSRQGKMLPSDLATLERVDLDKQDLNNYNAYKWDKQLDFNPLDGDFNLGVVRGGETPVHGKEVTAFGKSMSVNETGLPLLGALAGTVGGALLPNLRNIRLKRQGRPAFGRKVNRFKDPKAGRLSKIAGYIPEVASRDLDGYRQINPVLEGVNSTAAGRALNVPLKAIEGFYEKPSVGGNPAELRTGRVLGTIAGLSGAGLIGGTVQGLANEDERRRQQFADKYGEQVDYDEYKRQAGALLDTQIRMGKEAPPEVKASWPNKTAKSNRLKQEALYQNMLQQQTAVAGLVDEEKRRRGEAALRQQAADYEQLLALEERIANPHGQPQL